MPTTSDAASTYKAIIDQLAGETRGQSVLARRVSLSSPFPADSGRAAFNELLSSLSERQRELVSELLREERESAIHDVLAVFSWWIDCQSVGLSFEGGVMPVDFSGEGLHGDFTGRCTDWAWPE